MDKIMALAKRRGFIYQASEIYGGINGFWDYGPLGAQFKKNLRDAWWQDVVMNPCQGALGPFGERVRMVPLDSCIIQHPKVWEASGHIAGFNDPMVDDRETKQRYRSDHLSVYVPTASWAAIAQAAASGASRRGRHGQALLLLPRATARARPSRRRRPRRPGGDVTSVSLPEVPEVALPARARARSREGGQPHRASQLQPDVQDLRRRDRDRGRRGVPAPRDGAGHLRAVQERGRHHAREGAVRHRADRQGLPQRGHAAQLHLPQPRVRADGDRVLLPRERGPRVVSLLARLAPLLVAERSASRASNLQLREHDRDELAHYAKTGAGTSDIEYRFPSPRPASASSRASRIARASTSRSISSTPRPTSSTSTRRRGEPLPNGSRKGEKYLPHVIEPSAGLDRGVLALLCEAFTEDPSRPSPELLKIHPRLAPIKAAVYPLVNKDGMPEIAEKLYGELNARFSRQGFIEFDVKQSIGRRYARMDEAGCPSASPSTARPRRIRALPCAIATRALRSASASTRSPTTSTRSSAAERASGLGT